MSESSPLISANLYGRPSFIEKIRVFFKLLTLPGVIVWRFIFKWSGRTRKRSVVDGVIRSLLTGLNPRQVQYVLGTTAAIYRTWCGHVKQDPNVEAIGEGANLLWIGERKLDKVILYFHGGAFLFPPTEPAIKFWAHVRTKLGERGMNVSVAMLEYTLSPVAHFPTPLKQAVVAIKHLVNLGVKPENIQLVGDSAGGNLVLQVLAHLLHPVAYENVPSLSLSSPLKGACLVSPWVDLTDIHGTLKNGDSTDLLTTSSGIDWGSKILGPVPQEYRHYIEANSAKDDWWKGVDAVVDRVIITAGQEECLKDEIIRFDSVFEAFHSHVTMLEHQGVHDDPYFAVEVGESGGGAPDRIIDWCRDGFY